MTVALVDCHHHIYDLSWPVDPRATLAPVPKGIEAYRALKDTLGIVGSVVIQPSTYGYDNTGLLRSIESLGRASTRGVAVTDPGTPVSTLRALAAGGVVALRVNMQLNQAITTVDDVAKLAARCADMGWHLEINAPAALITQCAHAWRHLPCDIVLDHMANLPAITSADDAAWRAVAQLMETGRAWVKLSGPYFGSTTRPHVLAHSASLVRRFIKHATNRLVWGSNWPHPTESACLPPDERAFIEILRDQWIDTPHVRTKIFFDNAMQLYKFGAGP